MSFSLPQPEPEYSHFSSIFRIKYDQILVLISHGSSPSGYNLDSYISYLNFSSFTMAVSRCPFLILARYMPNAKAGVLFLTILNTRN